MNLREELLVQGYIEKQSDTRNKSKKVTYFSDTDNNIIAKVCLGCKELKMIKLFGKSKRGLGEKTSKCKECIKLYNSSYYQEKSEEVKKATTDYRLNNKDLVWNYKVKWREKNRERHSDNQKRWREENVEKYKTMQRLYLERKNILPQDIDEKQKPNMLNQQGGVCLLSGSKDVHLEYFIPLSWGHGGTLYGNCYYLDRELNISKWASNPFEWIERQPKEYQNRFHSILVPMLAERNNMTADEFRGYVYWCEVNKRELVRT